jgi:EAL domain-containing protein (putative c-di-GMP-specific phosphodiesterase class I)
MELGDPVTLAINLSGESIGDTSFLPVVVRELLAHPEVGQHLVFEITERTAVEDIEQAKRLIARLGEFGCRFSLDDFGAGVGGFHYLKHLPVEFLKLDGEFTRTLPGSALDHEIVAAIVQAAAGLGRTVIAECVEDEEILQALREFGIPLVQGIHVGRPAPAADLLGALAA